MLEACIDSLQGLQACIDGGADRIELCSALDLGGLTPSAGFMLAAAKCPIPVYAMIRPRAGGFHYTSGEIDVMVKDIEFAKSVGLAGVVLGAANLDGTLDQFTLAKLAKATSSMGRTLHRVFDCVPDRSVALETAIELGFERILTSGGALRAIDGLAELKNSQLLAQGRIEIMAGAGLEEAHIEPIFQKTGICSFHGGCRRALPSNNDLVRFGFSAKTQSETNACCISEIKQTLKVLKPN